MTRARFPCSNVRMTTTPNPTLFVIIETTHDADTLVRGPFESKAAAWAWLIAMQDEVNDSDDYDWRDEVTTLDESLGYIEWDDASWEISELIKPWSA